MKHAIAIVIALALALACTPATSAPETAPSSALAVPTANPVAFGDAMANRMASEGMAPIRDVLGQMSPQGLGQSAEVIAMFEAAIGGQAAITWRRVEDVTLADSLRRIYYMHAFEGTILFTRLDFVNVGARGWHLQAVFFGSTWDNVSTGLTPGFASSTP